MVGVSSLWDGQEDPLERKGGGMSGDKPHTCVPHSLLICCPELTPQNPKVRGFEWSQAGRVKGYQVEKGGREGTQPRAHQVPWPLHHQSTLSET